MKSFILICSSILLLGATLASAHDITTESPLPPQCNPLLIVDCNYYSVEFVWATNQQNTTCVPFVNRCVFNSVNCERYLNGMTIFEETTQEECQPKCVSDCGDAEPSTRVCAERYGETKYFENQCELDKYVCQNAEMWWATGDLVCESTTTTETTMDY